MVIYYTSELKDQMSGRLSIFSKFDMLGSFLPTLPDYENGMPELHSMATTVRRHVLNQIKTYGMNE